MKKAIKQSTITTILHLSSIVLAVIVAFSFLTLMTLNQKVQHAQIDRYELTYNAFRYTNAASYLSQQARSYAVTGEQVHYDNYMKEMDALHNREDAVKLMQTIGLTEREDDVVQELITLSDSLLPIEKQAMQAAHDKDFATATSTVFASEYKDKVASINVISERFLDMLEERSAARVALLTKQAAGLEQITMLFIAAIITMQIASWWIIHRKMIRPIIAVQKEMLEISQGNFSTAFKGVPDTSEIGSLIQSIHVTKAEVRTIIQNITDILQQVADHHLDVQVEGQYPNDFLPIKDALITIVETMNDTLNRLFESAEQVSGSSEQMSIAAQEIAHGAVSQSGAVEELSNSITHIAVQVNENASNAIQAAQLANAAGVNLNQSNKEMTKLIASMQQITNKSGEIHKIIKTIEDIAFQTNILALNAAVEAARAGGAGKGFAVVADEVRNLAGKSAEAAKSTNELIIATVAAVQEGNGLVSDTSNVLQEVVRKAQESTAIINRIAIASKAQAEAIDRFKEGVEEISAVVQTNSATSEETAASADELLRQAAGMKQLVQQFHLRRQKTIGYQPFKQLMHKPERVLAASKY